MSVKRIQVTALKVNPSTRGNKLPGTKEVKGLKEVNAFYILLQCLFSISSIDYVTEFNNATIPNVKYLTITKFPYFAMYNIVCACAMMYVVLTVLTVQMHVHCTTVCTIACALYVSLYIIYISSPLCDFTLEINKFKEHK